MNTQDNVAVVVESENTGCTNHSSSAEASFSSRGSMEAKSETRNRSFGNPNQPPSMHQQTSNKQTQKRVVLVENHLRSRSDESREINVRSSGVGSAGDIEEGASGHTEAIIKHHLSKPRKRSSSKSIKLTKKGVAKYSSDEASVSSNGSKRSTLSGSSLISHIQNSHEATLGFIVITLLLGAGAAAAFMGLGISSAKQQQKDEFERVAIDTVGYVSQAFEDYVHACSLVHSRCRHRDFTRQDFRELHEYLVASGLQYKAVQFDPNVTHADRAEYEQEMQEWLSINYPHVNYQGFRGFNIGGSGGLEPRTDEPFYFPIHYQEPIPGNEAAIDLDYWSSESRIRAVKALFDTERPSLTDRLSLVREAGQRSRCGNHDADVSYGVVLMHPGVPLDNPQPGDEVWPKDFSSIVLCIPDLLQRATETHGQEVIVYIHDLSTPDYVSTEPVFMGAVKVTKDTTHDNREVEVNKIGSAIGILEFLDEVPLNDLGGGKELMLQRDVPVANRRWKITVQAVDGTYKLKNITFVVVGGSMIFLSSVALAAWLYTNSRRMANLHRVQAEAEADRARLILASARNAAKAERELNDFIAHEIRNPVAAAMAATNFIKLELDEKEPLASPDTLETAREDIGIVENALKFVNDLLRNMLDMHRASTKQLQVTMAPTDLLHDVLEPVGGMLYQRGSKVKLIVDCPPDLYVETDALRLKQVMMNLGRNSSKFIDEGFIRLKAEVVDDGNNVHLYVDDSGCGIPLEKRQRLFAKYQESLDLLNQGTGIGLYLCKLLVELMGGEIGLDNDYDSGIPGHPGARFVINLNAAPTSPPLSLAQIELANADGTFTSRDGQTYTTEGTSTEDDIESLPYELPENLNVLFVDDDAIIRKLFSRSVKRLAPNWNVREAASGEAALRLVEEAQSAASDGDENGSPNGFDVIFIDMYMASVEKQMLGTETVTALRQRGVTSRLCGLSANDKELEFIQAGADAFLFKPFSCDQYTMSQDLCRVLYGDHQKDGGYTTSATRYGLSNDRDGN